MTGAAPFKYFNVQSSLALANASVKEIPLLFVATHFFPFMLACNCLFRSPTDGPVKKLGPPPPIACSGSAVSPEPPAELRRESHSPHRENTPELSLSMSRSVTSQRLASTAGLFIRQILGNTRGDRTFRLKGMRWVFPMVQSLQHLVIFRCYSQRAS